MIGVEEIEKLSLELNIDTKEIVEVFRHHIAEYYNVDWIHFTDDASVVLISFNNMKNAIERKRIYVKREYFKKIIENTILTLYKHIEKINLINLKEKLNLQKIEGVYNPETKNVSFYKKGVLQKEIVGKLANNYDNKELENKFTLYRILGKTLHKKNMIYVVNCIPVYHKKKEKNG